MAEGGIKSGTDDCLEINNTNQLNNNNNNNNNNNTISNKSTVTCYGCGQEGHIKKNCQIRVKSKSNYNQSNTKNSLICFYCKDEGHKQTECPLKIAISMSMQESGITPEATTFDSRKPAKSEASFLYYQDSIAKLISKIHPKTRIIDTHCHVEYVLERFNFPVSEYAFSNFTKTHCYPDNFYGCISTFCDPAAFSSLGCSEELLKEPMIWATFGIHPHNARFFDEKLKNKLCESLHHPKCVALGEIGLDFSKICPTDKPTQIRVFQEQLEIAVKMNKPIQIHCRDAEDELMNILLTSVIASWKIHLHCYTGTPEKALELITTFPNLYIGITGSITIKNLTQVKETVKCMPLERILLETDAPYMTPSYLKEHVRFSHPIMVLHVAERIAFLKSRTLNEVLEITNSNVLKMYSI